MRRQASLIVAFAACMLWSAAAFAQPASAGPPLESKRPPGFDPAPPRAAEPPRPPSGGLKATPAREPEWLLTRNTSDMSAWVTLYRGRTLMKAACIAAKQEQRWAIDDPKAPFTVKAELTRDADCNPPVACMAAIDRRPGMAALDLGGGQGCGWSVAAVRGGLKRESRMQSCCLVRNSTAHSMWVTVYEGVFRKITATACIQPGKSDWVWAGQLAWMRAEVTLNANCAQPVGCDTTMNVSGDAFTGDRLRGVVLLPSNWKPRGGCWWQFEDSYPRQ